MATCGAEWLRFLFTSGILLARLGPLLSQFYMLSLNISSLIQLGKLCVKHIIKGRGNRSQRSSLFRCKKVYLDGEVHTLLRTCNPSSLKA